MFRATVFVIIYKMSTPTLTKTCGIVFVESLGFGRLIIVSSLLRYMDALCSYCEI